MGDSRNTSAARACPKCGDPDVSTTYRDDSHEPSCHGHRQGKVDPGDRLSCPGCNDEHLDRRCRCCGYLWREEVLSS